MKKGRDITFVNVPLEADAYYVNVDLSEVEAYQLQRAWAAMNASLDKKKILMVLPTSMTLKQMPSEALMMWIAECTDILKERGHEVHSV